MNSILVVIKIYNFGNFFIRIVFLSLFIILMFFILERGMLIVNLLKVYLSFNVYFFILIDVFYEVVRMS